MLLGQCFFVRVDRAASRPSGSRTHVRGGGAAVSRAALLVALAALGTLAAACSPSPEEPGPTAPEAPPPATTPMASLPRPYELDGPLVPAHTTMVSAWDVPANPLTDPSLEGTEEAAQIRWGFRIFMETPGEAPRFAHGRVTCGNCHLNAGQRERALPLVGVSSVYPEHNRRAGRPFTLEDRIIDCFTRSENGTETPDDLPTPESPEVAAVAAYLRWLSRDYPAGTPLPWRGRNVIAADELLPMQELDPQRGQALFEDRCTSCHGVDGQGVQIGDKRAGPLWGGDSWNDGAGAARVYTLAGIIRHMMPYLDPGSLTDEEAQHIAAYITSKERPAYPFKERDYLTSQVPIDAVYYGPRGR
jgi:thiosulfate dehydrogenase